TDGIVVLDATHRVLFANPAACAMLAVDCDQLLGETFEYSIPEEGKPATYAVQLPDDPISPLTATAIVSIWDGREATIIQMQPALRPSVPPSVPPSLPPAMLGPRVSEDRLRAVGRLAAGLAHEVNNPLTFVLANLESLRESHQAIRRFIRKLRVDLATQEAITPQSFEQVAAEANLQEVIDDAADMLTDCYKGMHRIQDIARSLGTFSRADDNQAEMIDITRVVDDACAMVFNQIRYRARLVKRFEPIPIIAAFPGRIAQALVNMLTNAAEAIDGGTLRQTPHRGLDAHRRRARGHRGQRHRHRHRGGRPGPYLHARVHHQGARGGHGSGSHRLQARRPGARRKARGAPSPRSGNSF
ncbi:MAG: PAS domain-containing protein, partial [Deltaproteobacteria bacterium]